MLLFRSFWEYMDTEYGMPHNRVLARFLPPEEVCA